MEPTLREQMRALYDSYFESADYQRRYPQPNAGTLAFLMRHGALSAREVADVGCGTGRYAVPVLERTSARVTACDISPAAIATLRHRLFGTAWQQRVDAIVGPADTLPAGRRYDCILMMFGVLSHVGPRSERVATLRELHARAHPRCRLVLSVPSIWRRRPLELAAAMFRRDGAQRGDIRFTRRIAGRRQTFYYHLYTLRELRTELAEAGWRIEHAEAESLMPEWMVTQSSGMARLDGWVQRWLPAALGYGIRAMAVRVP